MQRGVWRQSQTLSLKERKLFREEGEQMMEERKKAARGKLGGGGGRRRGMLRASIQHGQLFDGPVKDKLSFGNPYKSLTNCF